MTRILFAASIALAFALPATASAGKKDPSPAVSKKAKAKKAKASKAKSQKAGKAKRAKQKSNERTTKKKEKFFDFLGDDLVGDGQLPGGELATVAAPIQHGSLIRYRPHFIAEILKSADDL